MKKLFSKLSEIVSDENNRLSSKRIVGLMASTFLCITLYQNSFSEENIAPSTPLVESVAALSFGCLGLASLDKYTKRKLSKETETKEEPQQ
jgi:hypothetical protein